MKITGKASGIGIEGAARPAAPVIPPAPLEGIPRAPRTWVVVADSRKAFIYQRVPNGLELIATAMPDDLPEEPVKRRSRSFTSRKGIHFAANPKDRKPHEGYGFVKEVTDWLERARVEGAFERLVLVAGPAVLGDFHATLPDGLHDIIYQELAKGMTGMPPSALQDYL